MHKPNSNLYGTLDYNFKKVAKKEASVLCTSGGQKNKKKQKQQQKKSMERCWTSCQIGSVPNRSLFTALLTHPEDEISEEAMQYFIDEYIEELAYGSQPYINVSSMS